MFNVSPLSLQEGLTALICASANGLKNVVQLLLAAGAKKDITDGVSIRIVAYIIVLSLCNTDYVPRNLGICTISRFI